MSASSVISLILEGQDNASAAFEAVQGQAGGLGTTLGSLLPGGPLAAGAAAGVAAVGAAVVGVGVAAFNMSQDMDSAMNNLQAQTGASKDEMGEFRDVALDVFNNNWGESFDDVAGAMATITQATGATGDELGSMTENALIMRDVFGLDVNESIGTVKTLMEEFGMSSNEAFDFITTGIQSGLNANDDFVDSIGEYSNLFSDAGFSAEEFFGVMESGQAGGVLGTDKVSDAVKEFGLIVGEMGDEAASAFSTLGYDIDPLMAMLSDGSTDIAEVFGFVIEDLSKIEDPIQRASLQTALFGTAAEDLGVNFTDSLTMATDSLDNMAGSTSAAGDAVSQGLGPALETFKRNVSTSLLPLGDALGDVVNQMTPYLEDLGAWLSEKIPVAIEATRAFWVDQAWPAILEAAGWIETNIVPHLETAAVWLGENVPVALETLRAFWVEEAWPVISETLDAIWGFIEPNILEPLAEWLDDKVPVALEFLRNTWVDVVWPAIQTAVETAWDIIKAVLEGTTEFFNETLPTALETIQEIWTTAWDDIANRVERAQERLQPIFDAITGFQSWLSTTSWDFNFNLPDLPEWMIPGSPIPLHTAWKNYGDYLDEHTFEPQFDTSQAEQANLLSTRPQFERNSVSGAALSGNLLKTAPISEKKINIEVNIYDQAAAALFLSYLESA